MGGAQFRSNIYRPIFRCLHQSLRHPWNPTLHARRHASGISRSRASSQPRTPPRNPLDPIAFHRLEAEYRRYYLRRMYFAAGGMATCMAITVAIVATVDIEKMSEKNDARPNNPFKDLEPGTPVIQGATGGAEIRKPGEGIPKPEEEHGDRVEQVPTGSDAVPTFPRTIELDEGSGKGKTEYQLMGLGVRAVSFLQIKVYVVGLYIATDDIAALQQALIRKLNPIATTLIPTEKDELQRNLLDPERGEEIWADVLRNTSLRTVVRIVPTRTTDFQHLKDGWIRAITTRAQAASRRGEHEFDDDSFAAAVRDFKAVFGGGGRKKVPKGKTILLIRNQAGKLSVLSEGDEQGKGLERLGDLEDERVSRLVWLNYLAGKNVASESARSSVVDGVMGFVQRPIGTVTVNVT